MTQAAGFREERTRRRINELIRRMNAEDQNWKWKAPVVKENEVWMWWEYLEEMNGDQGKAYFRLVYDKATGWFTVYDEHDEDITDQIEYYMKLDEWLRADHFNFAHDFIGIQRNINRGSGYPATDFNEFVPRFAGQ